VRWGVPHSATKQSNNINVRNGELYAIFVHKKAIIGSLVKNCRFYTTFIPIKVIPIKVIPNFGITLVYIQSQFFIWVFGRDKNRCVGMLKPSFALEKLLRPSFPEHLIVL
jgi:hypothetical protein